MSDCECFFAVAYTQIDWHDFVVVETVDFQPNEQGNLPPPTTADEVGARVLAQERIDKGEVIDYKKYISMKFIKN